MGAIGLIGRIGLIGLIDLMGLIFGMLRIFGIPLGFFLKCHAMIDSIFLFAGGAGFISRAPASV